MIPCRRRAFSLLEVILALAILAGAVTVLSQLSGNGLENARVARDSTRAQLYCESKMAEIAAGLTSPANQSSAPLEEDDAAAAQDWVCRVDVSPASQSGILELRVTVGQDPNVHARPVECCLVRWIADPDAQTSSSTGSDTSATGATP